MKGYCKYETITVDGMKFHVGFRADEEFSGEIFEVYKNGRWYGALAVACIGERELGWNSGVSVTDQEAETIKKAFKIAFKK